MSLQNIQNELAEMILSGDQPLEYVIPVKNLIVYRNNIITTLAKTLQNTYPLILKLVGEDFFHTIAQDYIQQYPSRSSNLHDYGEYFSHFLTEYSQLENLIYLPEVAQFEWICHTLYFAAHPPVFDIKLLNNLSPEQFSQLHFALHPASRVMKFHYPLLRIIDLCNGSSDENINIAEGGINLLIIRRELDIVLVTLTSAEYVFLNAIQDNHSVSVAFKAAVTIDPKFNLEEKLVAWIKDKTIVDITIAN